MYESQQRIEIQISEGVWVEAVYIEPHRAYHAVLHDGRVKMYNLERMRAV